MLKFGAPRCVSRHGKAHKYFFKKGKRHSKNIYTYIIKPITFQVNGPNDWDIRIKILSCNHYKTKVNPK